MQPNLKSKSVKPKFTDTKFLIAALAIAVTIGFWNLFSNNAYASEKTAPSVVVTLPPQQPSVAADILPPLPTLAPLLEVTIPQGSPASDSGNVSQPANQAPVTDNVSTQPELSSSLRVVGIPTQVIVQKKKPVFGSQVSAASSTTDTSSSSSSSSNSSSKSSSTTKSSKK